MDRLLTAPGLHFALTRFAGRRIGALAFDAKFQRGEWGAGAESQEIVELVEGLARGGSILMLGCGTGSIARQLDAASFSSFLGIDISPTAIDAAREFESAPVRFEIGDMTKLDLSDNYDTVLLLESLYYLRPDDRMHVLDESVALLNPGGSVVVTLADADRYQQLIAAIHSRYHVTRDSAVDGSVRRVIVLQGRPGTMTGAV